MESRKRESEEKEMEKILVVGSLNLDLMIEVEKLPTAGQTILGKSAAMIPGGKGANQAYAAGKLGGNVRMIGAVGWDIYGEKLLRNLQDVKVDTSGIEFIEESETGKAIVEVDAEGRNFITVIPGANEKLTKEMIDKYEYLIDECGIVILQLEIPLEVVAYVKEMARKKGKRIILDPAPAREVYPEGFLEEIDIIKPNEGELQTMIGHSCLTKEELTAGARELLEKGVRTVIVTLGGKGCLLVTKETEMMFPSEKVKAVDTTAAGDCFTAGLAVELSRGKTIEEAIVYGSRASAIAVTRKGAQTSIPDEEEIKQYFFNV